MMRLKLRLLINLQVDYDDLTLDNMVVLDLDGNIVEGNYRPSSDTKTHLEVYKAYKSVKGICHVHSTYATAFAQAGKSIDAYGTTHADYFYGSIPCACFNKKKKSMLIMNNQQDY